jgi:hypothetical protein
MVLVFKGRGGSGRGGGSARQSAVWEHGDDHQSTETPGPVELESCLVPPTYGEKSHVGPRGGYVGHARGCYNHGWRLETSEIDFVKHNSQGSPDHGQCFVGRVNGWMLYIYMHYLMLTMLTY